ncbi:MAG: hypothetical protein QFX37_06265 [Archaeoglobales archaeon]|nr:hypothetical protein [Archaeoglobales archaeon]
MELPKLIGREAEIYRFEDWFFIHIVANRVANFESIPNKNKPQTFRPKIKPSKKSRI